MTETIPSGSSTWTTDGCATSARIRRCSTAVLLTLWLSGCTEVASDRDIQIADCESRHGLEPDCRFRGPRDLAVVPGLDWILVSQGADGELTGELLAYRPPRDDAGIVHRLYPGGPVHPELGWGEAECAAPEGGMRFSPRGIDAVRRHDGRIEVVAVNQGERRAVELFEWAPVDPDAVESDASIGEFELIWRGCVRAPAAASFGDIAADPQGGFWVTQAFPRQRPFWCYLNARMGFSTGHLYRWQLSDGFERLADTAARLPSGIALAPDRRHVFYGTYLGDEVLKFDTQTRTVVGRVPVMQPNKMSWARDGSLLVASHTAGFIERAQCDGVPLGACGFSFEVIAIVPGSMQSMVLLAHEGAPIGAVDVAVDVGSQLYLASPLGDRIVRFPLEGRAGREH
jgi:sugar lactone lactonase YvrE